MNILQEHWDISNYRATLGHKINHSFMNVNVKFQSVIHPRFGPIVAAISLIPITKGEEILASYGYSPETNVPRWFAKAYEEEMKMPWPGQFIYNDFPEHWIYDNLLQTKSHERVFFVYEYFMKILDNKQQFN